MAATTKEEGVALAEAKGTAVAVKVTLVDSTSVGVEVL